MPRPYCIDLAKESGLFIEYDQNRPEAVVIGMYVDGDKVASIRCDRRIIWELVAFFEEAPRRLDLR